MRSNETHSIMVKAVSLISAGELEEASVYLKKMLFVDPTIFSAYGLLGAINERDGRMDKGILLFQRCLTINPRQAGAHLGLSNIYRSQRIYDKSHNSAINSYLCDPTAIDAYKAVTFLQTLGIEMVAKQLSRRAVLIDIRDNEAISLLGYEYKRNRDLCYAQACFTACICLSPERSNLYLNLGITLQDGGLLLDCERCYFRAWLLNPNQNEVVSSLIYTRLRLCMWDDIDVLRNQFLNEVNEGTSCQLPFVTLHLTDDPSIQMKTASKYFSEHHLSNANLDMNPKYCRRISKKINLAYFSADIHDHATMRLFIDALENHDRDLFNVSIYSIGENIVDAYRKRAIACSDEFYDVSEASLGDLRQLANEKRLDIAIDLKGYTKESKVELFAERIAPIQISFLGYPGTTCIPTMDYIIADEFIIPEHLKEFYSERVIHLAGCYQPNPPIPLLKNQYPEPLFDPSVFIYCSFNAPTKINPEMFRVWMRILSRVSCSILWLFVDSDCAMLNLRKTASYYGISPARIVFFTRCSHEKHLARMGLANLFLDSFPCSAHTTASDAIRMGLPILTMIGRSFASRVAGSLLNSCRVNELITSSFNEYEETAVRAAKDPSFYLEIKKKIEYGAASSTTFDSSVFMRKLESAYKDVYNTYISGDFP